MKHRTTMHKNIDAGMLKEFSIGKPKCVIGIIASGEQFITVSKKHSKLKLDEFDADEQSLVPSIYFVIIQRLSS
jgi:hypothetical protein